MSNGPLKRLVKANTLKNKPIPRWQVKVIRPAIFDGAALDPYGYDGCGRTGLRRCADADRR
jgi:hypothetical protein